MVYRPARERLDSRRQPVRRMPSFSATAVVTMIAVMVTNGFHSTRNASIMSAGPTTPTANISATPASAAVAGPMRIRHVARRSHQDQPHGHGERAVRADLAHHHIVHLIESPRVADADRLRADLRRHLGQRIPGLRLDRPSAALCGAVLMVLIGTLSQREAYAAIDLDTLTLLLGMMIIAAYLAEAAFFRTVAYRAARTPAARARCW